MSVAAEGIIDAIALLFVARGLPPVPLIATAAPHEKEHENKRD
jgi:hypothetical protein